MKAALLALMAIASGSVAQADECKLTQIATLPIVFDRGGGPTVPVTLGNKQTRMLVDTGGVYSMIGQHVVDELKPNVNQIKGTQFRLINDQAMKQIAHIRPFALGEMSTHEHLFLVIPDGVAGPKDLDGTIAPDILANFDVEFDFAGKKMNLFSQDHCVGKVVYWAKDWAEIPFSSPDNMHITVDMMLDGNPMKAELDTGSSVSYLNASIAKEMFGIDANVPGATPAGPHGAFSHTFKSLTMNGVAIGNPEFLILSDEHSSLIGHYGKMLLGMKQLSRLHLYVAYKEQVLYVTSADAGTQ